MRSLRRNAAQRVVPAAELAPDQCGEDGDDEQLKENDQPIEIGHKADAAQIDGNHDGGESRNPDPVIDLGEHRGQIDLGQQNIDHGRQQIVQQRRPAHHEAHVRVNGLLRIGIGRAG